MSYIYCDEAGYSGDNLLDHDSAFFVFSSINISPKDATELVTDIKRRHRIQAELKAKNLLRNDEGREEILSLVSQYAEKAKIIFFDKKFALACKFYQYIFEDVLVDENHLLIEMRFNSLIANALYFALRTNYSEFPTLMSEFQKLMRSQDLKGLKLLFSKASNDSDIDFFLGQILTFAYLHKDKIRSELDPLLIGEEGGKWILELSHSAIFTLLSSWGEIFESLNVYCDRSKPLAAKQDFFNAMVNREDKHNLLIRGEKLNLTFNLAGPIQFVDSRQHSGIQLADVLASSLCYALNNPGDFSLELRRQLWPAIHRFSMIPDPDDLDLMKRGPYVNSLLLHELIERSEAGRNLLENIREFILSADSSYPGYIEQQYLEACKEQDLQAALR